MAGTGPIHAADGSAPVDGLGAAVGCIPSGLFVVTAGNGQAAAGYLGSFVQQVSLDPLRLVLAVHPQRPVYRLARLSGELVVHVLGRDDEQLVQRFWDGLATDELLELPHRRSALGTPILESGVLAYIRCRLLGEWPGGDHAVLHVEAEEGQVLAPGGRPYFYRRATGRTY